MESVVSLLATVTRALSSIKEGSTKEPDGVTSSAAPPGRQDSSVPSEPSAPDPAPPASEAAPATQQAEVPGKFILRLDIIYAIHSSRHLTGNSRQYQGTRPINRNRGGENASRKPPANSAYHIKTRCQHFNDRRMFQTYFSANSCFDPTSVLHS
jgi:hypothetical protein